MKSKHFFGLVTLLCVVLGFSFLNNQVKSMSWDDTSLRLELGESIYMSGNFHGNFVYSGIRGGGFLQEEYGIISFISGQGGSFDLAVHVGDRVHLDILTYKVTEMNNGYITLQKIA